MEYKKARNKATRECRKAKIRMERKVAQQAKDNNKCFWSYIKDRNKVRTGVSDLLKADGSKTSSDSEKAQVLNDFFQSVFTEEPDGDLPNPPTFEFKEQLNDTEITVEEVKKLLSKMKIGKAAGPDNIPPILLVEAADTLATPVSIIFKKSLEHGQLPNEWKQANITPIFKKGSRTAANNYRPVSLTSVLCKAMESLLRNRVMDHLQENDLICKEQHGFTPGRSCTTQLLDTLDCWTEILDQGGCVDAVYTDFQKAFDTVPHRRLMLKVKAHGISGKLYNWIENFLSGRSQRVYVNGSSSESAQVTSGIPQGSVLGPLLFVIYINDLPQHVKSQVRIFADDTKLFTRSDTEEARDQLQQDLDSLQKWSDDWLLRFHPQKCCVMHIGHQNEEKTYFMNVKDSDQKHPLAKTEAEKDLGVTVDNKLSFKQHINQVTSKANRNLGIIRRTFDHLPNHTFVLLYKAMVRPILEYGHSVWNPAQKMLIKELEDVQRRATKLVGGLKNKPYPERLKTLKLPSLEFRRLRGDVIDVYKYITGLYDTSRPELEKHTGRETRGNSIKLAVNRSRLNVRSSFFSQRIVKEWNDLPEAVVTASSINSFKSRLDAHWKDHPKLYYPTCY